MDAAIIRGVTDSEARPNQLSGRGNAAANKRTHREGGSTRSTATEKFDAKAPSQYVGLGDFICEGWIAESGRKSLVKQSQSGLDLVKCVRRIRNR